MIVKTSYCFIQHRMYTIVYINGSVAQLVRAEGFTLRSQVRVLSVPQFFTKSMKRVGIILGYVRRIKIDMLKDQSLQLQVLRRPISSSWGYSFLRVEIGKQAWRVPCGKQRVRIDILDIFRKRSLTGSSPVVGTNYVVCIRN